MAILTSSPTSPFANPELLDIWPLACRCSRHGFWPTAIAACLSSLSDLICLSLSSLPPCSCFARSDSRGLRCHFLLTRSPCLWESELFDVWSLACRCSRHGFLPTAIAVCLSSLPDLVCSSLSPLPPCSFFARSDSQGLRCHFLLTRSPCLWEPHCLVGIVLCSMGNHVISVHVWRLNGLRL